MNLRAVSRDALAVLALTPSLALGLLSPPQEGAAADRPPGTIVLQTDPAPATPAAPRFGETVVVTATAAPAPLGNVGRAVTVIGREEFERLPVSTVADLLRCAALDVRTRGERGVQADFSVRGASFGQTLVLVDGVRLNDVQTGHHNGDLPVPLADVERIEVLRGAGSSLHGTDAFGGTIQVITRRTGPRLAGRLARGSFEYWDASLSGRVVDSGRSAGLTLAGRRSDGFTEDRDFAVFEGRGVVEWHARTRLSAGYVDKEFGARGFYGPAPSREWTTQTLLSLDRVVLAGERVRGTAQAYFRSHRDHFLYDRRRPALADNRHRTYAGGLVGRLHRDLGGAGRLSFGAEAGGDLIESSVLGERGYGHASLSVELQRPVEGVLVYPGLRLDAYGGGFGWSLSPSLAANGRLGGIGRWRASAGHGFRVPTFTEVAYRDPNHEASGDLDPERAWAVDGGVDLATSSSWGAGVTLFVRRDTGLIDWVRATPAEPWRTRNIREATTRGIEGALRLGLGASGRLALEYGYLDVEAPGLRQQSKYVRDFARHSLALRASSALAMGLFVGHRLEYRRRADGRSAWLADLRLGGRLGRCQGYVEASNLLDVQYQEVLGVDLPGRTFLVGIEFGRESTR